MKKTFILLIIHTFFFIFVAGCSNDKQLTVETHVISLVDVVQCEESDVFTVAFDRYHTDIKQLPIGVFDSGIGGLTVLSEIVRLDLFNNETQEAGPDGSPDFEGEHFIYLGDQANMPYGTYPSENKEEFLRELILKDAIFLLGQRYWPSDMSVSPRYDKPPVKAIVIACNTATVYGLEHIRDALEQWNIPVYLIGVVEAGANGAVEMLNKNGVEGTVAVMATVGTCMSKGYVRAIEKSSSNAGIKTPMVIQQGCLGLAGAIEGNASYITTFEDKASEEYQGPAVGNSIAPIDPTLLPQYAFEPSGILGDFDDTATLRLNSVENYIRYHTTSLVEKYRKSGNPKPINTVILGCTHFPYQVGSIAASFERLRTFVDDNGSKLYNELIAEHISFIDPAKLTAVQLYKPLRHSGLLLRKVETSVTLTDEFYISVSHPSIDEAHLTENKTFTYDYKYSRNHGRVDIEYVKRVPMSRRNLSPTVIKYIMETMPWIWERLVSFNLNSPRCRNLPCSSKITFIE